MKCIWINFTTVQAPYAYFYFIFYTFLEETLYLTRLVWTSCAISFITVSTINLKPFEL